ncbi:protein phosphatase 2C domain-containing protein [Nocardia brasiliensis]|uniref:protein phosphatase 2C domain-containing protein n=1 Tax=Nocardia brasiliensis TaxID=37326 RepID=UPI00245438AF|nr:protein phosphatase 2C domain-containing protein [Nocardia brasiliensis]
MVRRTREDGRDETVVCDESPQGSGSASLDCLTDTASPQATKSAPDDAQPSPLNFEPPRPREVPAVQGRVAANWKSTLYAGRWPEPGLAADFGRLGGATVIAASAIGRSHAHHGLQRQDHYAFTAAAYPDGTEVALMAVADGVSNAPFGGPAAGIASREFVRHLAGLMSDSIEVDEAMTQALRHAQRKIVEFIGYLPEHRPVEYRECATTLVAAAVLHADEVRAHILSVGDSLALLVGPEATLHPATPYEKSTSLTRYIPRENECGVRAEVTLSPGSLLLLGTDGLVNDLLDSRTICSWFLDHLREVDSIHAAAYTLAYQRQGSSDDRTFISFSVDREM